MADELRGPGSPPSPGDLKIPGEEVSVDGTDISSRPEPPQGASDGGALFFDSQELQAGQSKPPHPKREHSETDQSESELSPVGGGTLSAGEMREWHSIQRYYESHIRTISQFPVALVALGLILIYFSGIICSLAISGLLWLIFSPLIEMLSEPFFYPLQFILRLSGWRMLLRGEARQTAHRSRCPALLAVADMVARIRVPRVLCVLLVLIFVGLCFWLLIAKTFTSVIGD
ncbi:hypothetical protein T492DRAFT_209975 [Pavlovales sp. CCMP2436]|nr:hypothetical protein T492DRAFT_209975 [Pavlovales sp. CCMP2436]